MGIIRMVSLCISGMFLAGLGFIAVSVQGYEQGMSMMRAIINYCVMAGFSESVLGIMYLKGKQSIKSEYLECL